MHTVEQLKELSESRCRTRCQSFENIEYELSKCSCVFAFLSASATFIAEKMRADESFALDSDELYGLSYLLEGFQKSVDRVLDVRGRSKAA